MCVETQMHICMGVCICTCVHTTFNDKGDGIQGLSHERINRLLTHILLLMPLSLFTRC